MLTPGATCLERATLQESLDRVLDRRLDSTGLRVEVQGSAYDPRTAVIRLARAGEPLAQRDFSPGPPRCADFHAAIALAIALMLKNMEHTQPAPSSLPSRAEEPRTSTPGREPSPAAPLARPPRARSEGARDVTPEPRAPRTTPLHIAPLDSAPLEAPHTSRSTAERRAYWRAQASGVLGLQTSARLSRGLTADLVYASSRFELQLGVLALFSQERALQDSALHYSTRPRAASLTVATRLLTRPSLSLRISLGFLAGRMRTEIDDDGGSVAASSQRVRWFAGKAALELTLRIAGQAQLVLGAGPLWNVRKLGVSAYDADSRALLGHELFRPVGALLGLGLAYERPVGAFLGARARGRASIRQGFGVGRHP